MVSAEITAVEGREYRLARELIRLGFRVLHMGATISVDGPDKVWEQVFAHGVPDELRELIADIAYQVPPDFYRGPT